MTDLLLAPATVAQVLAGHATLVLVVIVCTIILKRQIYACTHQLSETSRAQHGPGSEVTP